MPALRIILTHACLLAAVLLSAVAQPILGDDLQVNTTTAGDQFLPDVAVAPDGDFIVVWSDPLDIAGQRFDGAGSALGGEFQINTYTTSFQFGPAIGVDGGGGFVVVWYSGGQDGDDTGVFGQRHDSAGNAVGSEFQVNTNTAYYQERPDVAVNAGGDFVVVWTDDGYEFSYYEYPGQDGSEAGVFGQRYSSSGAAVGGEFQINSYTTGSQDFAAVASDAAGDFVVVWTDYGDYTYDYYYGGGSTDSPDGSSRGVFGQRFDSSGAAVGGEFQVNSYTTGPQEAAEVAMNAGGDFIVVWQSRQDGSGLSIHGQRYDSAGSPAGGEFQVNTQAPGDQSGAAVATADDGSFTVVWTSSNQDGSGAGVFGQAYDSSGSPVGGEYQVNAYTTNSQNRPAIASNGGGEARVVWQSRGQDGSSLGIFTQGSAAPPDSDEDGIPDDEDNCPEDHNPGQEDFDEDGEGDACDRDDIQAECQDVEVDADATTCTAVASIDDGSFDPDLSPLTRVQVPAGPYPAGATNVELQLSDDEGESASCTATVTVDDVTPPAFSDLPDPIVVEGGCLHSLTPVDVPLPEALDACAGAVTVTSDSPGGFPVGTTTVTFTAVDPSNNVATATVDVTVFVTPRGMKEAALDALEALVPSGDRKTDKTLEKAIRSLEKSLDDRYWLDDEHLTDRGKKVFDEEKKAVKELQKLLDDDSDSDSGSDSDSRTPDVPPTLNVRLTLLGGTFEGRGQESPAS